ncbi:hypothetical protein LOD99_8630 [Oopsacas minuta]|uniref:Uncharacterized protein n=1 Tax=Oopsacas minuta TaxID=111878 RepID=A0AAV7JFY0_9METZ|nr:hypothetical protein LOD99_8630 [Oopsacas minuta]
MNNQEAFDFLISQPSIRTAVDSFIQIYDLSDGEFSSIRRRFSKLKSERDAVSKCNDLSTWQPLLFFSTQHSSPTKKRIIGEERMVFAVDLAKESRKPLPELALKALRCRLKPLLDLIATIAENENVHAKIIATYALQLISNEANDQRTANSCKDLPSNGTFACSVKRLPIDKSVFSLDFLEIGNSFI